METTPKDESQGEFERKLWTRRTGIPFRRHSVEDLVEEHDRSSSACLNTSSPPLPDTAALKNTQNPSLFQYFCSELTRSYWLENDEARYSERREKVYTFVKMPRDVEKFILYGSLQCLDAFLFVFTFLPLRFFLALWFLVSRPCIRIFRYRGRRRATGGSRVLTPSEICDVLKGVTLIVSVFLMTYIDTSMLYHVIKSQSVIKLYIFFNMLEVADRLLSAFGQDVLDTLFWTATETKERKREHFGVIPHLFFAIVYVVLHTILVLLQATTLNVAINSSNKALLTIMMSNNFIELKGSVFKRFGKNNLFQMSCSDVRERFTYFILLLTVIIQTMKEYNWKGGTILYTFTLRKIKLISSRFWILLPDCLCVLISEVVVDCVKHAFITRFNEIPTEVYHEYTVSLAYDLACSKHKNAFSDHSDLVARRMGFIPLPLSVLLIRITSQSICIPNLFGVFLLFLVYICLVLMKVLNSIVILGQACMLIDEHQKTKGGSQQSMSQQQPTQQQPQRSSSHPPSRKQSTERTAPVLTSKSVSHSRNPSYTDSTADSVATLIENQQPLGPQPIFCNSTVSLNSLGINETLLEGGLTSDSLQDIARKLYKVERASVPPNSNIVSPMESTSWTTMEKDRESKSD